MIKLYMMDETGEGQSFDLEGDAIYVGRGSDNDIQIRDRAVSRRHLKIFQEQGRYFIEDLGSRNGTFVNGEQIETGARVEVKEGAPIVIGMSVLCLGKACLDEVMPFLDSLSEDAELIVVDRPMTPVKNMELINKVSDVLTKSSNIHEILEKILDGILEVLSRIDRGVIILFDEETGQISDVITKTKESHDTTMRLYSRTVVNRVRTEGKPIVMRDTFKETRVDVSDSMKLMNVRSVLCVPLVSKSRIKGVLYVDSVKRPYGFRDDDLSLLSALSSPAAIAIENAKLYGKGTRNQLH
ncbi:MAG: FHA domain-containing protein [Deltaproteobacteria bacterium]|nr:FHA domain-containing protein [Deltaproteobacteria bacterium]MBW2137376.1 FHA domain-containing protein [Deltaproteobacteria bacterium]